MLTITLEEHFVSPDVAVQGDQSSNFPSEIQNKLLDLSTQRLSAMDDGGVSRQIFSHVPVDIPPELCTQANDELASAISKYPTRFSGFAELPSRIRRTRQKSSSVASMSLGSLVP